MKSCFKYYRRVFVIVFFKMQSSLKIERCDDVKLLRNFKIPKNIFDKCNLANKPNKRRIDDLTLIAFRFGPVHQLNQILIELVDCAYLITIRDRCQLMVWKFCKVGLVLNYKRQCISNIIFKHKSKIHYTANIVCP